MALDRYTPQEFVDFSVGKQIILCFPFSATAHVSATTAGLSNLKQMDEAQSVKTSGRER
jgi:hypothetical protein